MRTDNDVLQESKGEVLAGLISSLHTSVMNTSMNTALEWAAKAQFWDDLNSTEVRKVGSTAKRFLK